MSTRMPNRLPPLAAVNRIVNSHVRITLQVAEGGRHLLTDYSLKKRNMLGTTTMDAEMSFITANLARVSELWLGLGLGLVLRLGLRLGLLLGLGIRG